MSVLRTGNSPWHPGPRDIAITAPGEILPASFDQFKLRFSMTQKVGVE